MVRKKIAHSQWLIRRILQCVDERKLFTINITNDTLHRIVVRLNQTGK
jgi:hypothetical protein